MEQSEKCKNKVIFSKLSHKEKYKKRRMDMKSKKLKTLAVAVVLSLTIGAVPPVTGTEIPMITTTVEAAAKKVSLKAYNKKVYVGRSGKIKVKSTRGAKLSYKVSVQ